MGQSFPWRRVFRRSSAIPDISQSVTALADNLLGRRAPLTAGTHGLLSHETAFFNHYIEARERLDLRNSHSQLGQDLWASYLLGEGTSPRYFVEFGAFDGRTLSNTFYLERDLQWSGILAEPIPAQAAACRRNRGCIVDDRCVWSRSGERLSFNVVSGANELGTIAAFETRDLHGPTRTSRSEPITVYTVSLVDLLKEHRAPGTIDYMSVDTEGSELDILSAFSFSDYHIKILSVEHNYTADRDRLRLLLEANGYFRLGRSVDYFDDIYLHRDDFSSHYSMTR